jgi:ADP-ribosyl-[dinitrogen reductase] hydrolase
VRTPFIRSYWVIPGELLAGTYPGDKDPAEAAKKLRGLLDCGIRHVVNLMEKDEVDHSGRLFVPYGELLVRLGADRGVHVFTTRRSIRDMQVPTVEAMNAILDEIDRSLETGRPVYVHCWGGRGRTGTVVGCYLVRQGMKGDEALKRIKELRKGTPDGDMPSPETKSQRELVVGWGKMDRPPSRGDVLSGDLLDRYRGCLMGLAVGDALGTTLEFKPPGTFQPISDMMGGGPFHLKPGEWTDDTSMALCLAESLIECRGFDAADQMRRYVRWYREGHLSSTGRCFDIGGTVRGALHRFERTGDPWSGSTDPRSAGNGSIMRLAPVPLFFAENPEAAIDMSGESSRTTHGASVAVDACRYLGALIVGALHGASKEELLSELYSPVPGCWERKPLAPEIEEIASGCFKRRNPPEIRGTGYVVQSLEAALWAFHRGSTFEEGCLLAVNLGDDADTTGAVYGQIAGAHYGYEGIPEKWRRTLAYGELIDSMAHRLRDPSSGV